MAGDTQEPVSFGDVAVYLSRAEWDAIGEGQRELYRSVMLDNYELLTSLGYPGPKPDILYRMERGEEPWICTPPSPLRWDGSDSPSAGHNGDAHWLPEPPCGWWPGAGGCRVREERTPSPRPGGWCGQWRLRSRRLLSKLGGLEGRGRSLPEAAGRGTGLQESQKQAQAEEEEAEDKQGDVANETRSRGFPVRLVTEEQNKRADPQERPQRDPMERFPRSTPTSRCALGEATFFQGNAELPVQELFEIILRDHCYCALSKMQHWRCAQRQCPLRDHNYCRSGLAAIWALKDHEYYQVRRFPPGNAWAAFRRLAKRKYLIGRIIRRAKRMMWHRKPGSKRPQFPRGSSGAVCPSEPAIPAVVPPLQAEDDPAEGTRGVFCAPIKQEPVSPPPQGEGGSQGGTSEAICAPGVSFEPLATPPASKPAVEVKEEAPDPEVDHCEVQIWGCDVNENAEEQEVVYLDSISLHDAYHVVLQTVSCMLHSVCQSMELGVYSQHKETQPVIVQISH